MSRPTGHGNRRRRGFTLVELAVVLLIVALLLGGLLPPLGIQQDLRTTRETAATMETMIESLIGFAVAKGRLPCPDTDLDGKEDCDTTVYDIAEPSTGECIRSVGRCVGTACEGGVPFSTLGLNAVDRWGSRFRYRVSSAFLADHSTVYSGACGSGMQISTSNGFSLNAIGDITIKTRGDNPNTSTVRETRALLNLADELPAVIISHGKNRYGGIGADGTTMTAPPSQNRDEVANAAFDKTKIARNTPTTPASGCDDSDEARPACEFDDLVAWLSPHVLFSRMIAAGHAGRLP